MSTGPLPTNIVPGFLSQLFNPGELQMIRGMITSMVPSTGLIAPSTATNTPPLDQSNSPQVHALNYLPSESTPAQSDASNFDPSTVFNEGMNVLASFCPEADQAFNASVKSMRDLSDEEEVKLPEFKLSDMIDTLAGCDSLGGLIGSVGDLLKGSEDLIPEMDRMFVAVMQTLGVSTRQTMGSSMLTLFMNNGDTRRVEQLLCQGLDPNVKIRRDTWLVHLCKTIPMLELLMAHGLDLTINDPLRSAPFPVFRAMIEDYGVDPWKYYGTLTSTEHCSYLNRILRRRRKSLRWHLGRTGLLSELRNLIIDYMLPRPVPVDRVSGATMRLTVRRLKMS